MAKLTRKELMTSYQPNKTKIKVGLYFISNFIEKYVTNPISDSFDFFKHFFLLLIGQSALNCITIGMKQNAFLKYYVEKCRIF